MMRSIGIIVFGLLVFTSCNIKGQKTTTTTATEQTTETKPFVLYLVRHAEKDTTQTTDNPELTSCGTQRAKHLAAFLKEASIQKVYSTDFIRTQHTAQPTAVANALEITSYDPNVINDVATSVLEAKENALIVGHSNTTAVLAGILTGKELGAFDEHIYDRIYKVEVTGAERKLELLTSDFACDVD